MCRCYGKKKDQGEAVPKVGDHEVKREVFPDISVALTKSSCSLGVERVLSRHPISNVIVAVLAHETEHNLLCVHLPPPMCGFRSDYSFKKRVSRFWSGTGKLLDVLSFSPLFSRSASLEEILCSFFLCFNTTRHLGPSLFSASLPCPAVHEHLKHCNYGGPFGIVE